MYLKCSKIPLMTKDATFSNSHFICNGATWEFVEVKQNVDR